MADPTTLNTGLAIQSRGSNPGTWDTPLNADFVALDGLFGGVQAIAVSNANITLTAPSGFTATPSAGPVQSQNAVLRFTGTMTANVQVTLPVPGFYIIENLVAAGGNIIQFKAAGSGEVICVDRGDVQHIYNDGSNVRFVNTGRLGHIEMWAGLSAMPAWVTNCTIPPYLLCDGTVYNFSTYPYLGARLGSAFGGNGTTTFGVPDLRGRVPLPYDSTGSRITAGGSGINGQVIGSAADNQSIALTAGQIPSITSSSPGVSVSGSISGSLDSGSSVVGGGTGIAGGPGNQGGSSHVSGTFSGNTAAINVVSNNTSGQAHSNVQPSQITGIAVIKAA